MHSFNVWTAGFCLSCIITGALAQTLPIETWKRVEPAITGRSDIAFGDGKFVAVGDGFSSVSTNGITWTSAPLKANRIIYGGGRWLAAGNTDIAISGDAKNWTVRSIATDAHLEDVAYGNGRYVLISAKATHVSTDAIFWQKYAQPNPSVEAFVNLSFSDGIFIAGTRSSLWVSENGIEFSRLTEPLASSQGYAHKVIRHQGLYVGGTPQLGSSTDGTNWIKSQGFGSAVSDVMQVNGLYLATEGVSKLWWSLNALDWTGTMPVPSGTTIYAFEFGADRYVIVSNNGLYYSDKNTPLHAPSLSITTAPLVTFTDLAPGHRYTVESSPSPSGPWTTAETIIPSFPTHEWTDTSAPREKLFYRIVHRP